MSPLQAFLGQQLRVSLAGGAPPSCTPASAPVRRIAEDALRRALLMKWPATPAVKRRTRRWPRAWPVARRPFSAGRAGTGPRIGVGGVDLRVLHGVGDARRTRSGPTRYRPMRQSPRGYHHRWLRSAPSPGAPMPIDWPRVTAMAPSVSVPPPASSRTAPLKLPALFARSRPENRDRCWRWSHPQPAHGADLRNAASAERSVVRRPVAGSITAGPSAAATAHWPCHAASR